MNPTTQQEDNRALTDEELDAVGAGSSLLSLSNMFEEGIGWREFFLSAHYAAI
jgi:hypothetical protein